MASGDWARPVVRWEIEARDPEAQKRFYAELFNWDIGEGFIMPIEAGIGAPEPGPGGHIRQSDQSRVPSGQGRDYARRSTRRVQLG